jgi:hypothetical protein
MMGNKINIYCRLLFIIGFAISFFSCRKEHNFSPYDTSANGFRVYDDSSMVLPIEVVAGNNNLLCAYYTREGTVKMMLTDNNGNKKWVNQFGLTTVRGMLKEADGTFTVFSDKRMINFKEDTVLLKNDSNFLNILTGYNVMHVVLNKNNNYFFYGNYYTGSSYAFAAEISHDGTVLFKKFYSIWGTVTGCQFTDDGGYLFFGNIPPHGSVLSADFFLTKANSAGIEEWTKSHVLDTLPTVNPGGTIGGANYGYSRSSYTNDILPSGDGNYYCFTNSPDIVAADQRARIYKVNVNGDLLDSTYIESGAKYNRYIGAQTNTCHYGTSNAYGTGYGVLRKKNGSFVCYMQAGLFGATGGSNTIAADCNSFYVNIGSDLKINNIHFIQKSYSDCFNSVCETSDGKTIAFGLIASFGSYYKPILIFNDFNF